MKPWPLFTLPKKLPPAVISSVRTPGTLRTSRSTARVISSINARLVPSGAVIFSSNSASSPPVGMNSWATTL